VGPVTRIATAIQSSVECLKKYLGHDIHVIKSQGWNVMDDYLLLAFAYPPFSFAGINPSIPIDFDVPQKNIILLTIDRWLDDDDLLFPPSQRSQTSIDKLKQQVASFGDKTFYILTTSPFLTKQQFFADCPNIEIIYWGDEYLLQPVCYLGKTVPVSSKTMSSDYHWIFLCQRKRLFRVMAAVFLLGSNLAETGLIRAPRSIFADHDSWQELLNYLDYNQCNFLDSVLQDQGETLRAGFNNFKNGQYYIDNEHDVIYTSIKPDNFENFRKNLQNYYANTVVEIVGETLIISPGIITEKYVATVYGFNFPIILGSRGSVKHLRNQGFDLFDDIIDHSYDSTDDPMKRIFSAIDLNKEILRNRALAINAWTKCKDRFMLNYKKIEEIYATTSEIATQNIENFFLRKL
jgi:hypothetical protein